MHRDLKPANLYSDDRVRRLGRGQALSDAIVVAFAFVAMALGSSWCLNRIQPTIEPDPIELDLRIELESARIGARDSVATRKGCR